MTMHPALAVLRSDVHISISALNSFLRCPRSHEFRYLLKEQPAHRPSALVFGSAIHTSLSLFYSQLLESRPEPPAEELQAAFSDAWAHELSGSIPVLFGCKEDPDALKDMGLQLLTTFHEQAPRPFRIVGVEEPFSVELRHPDTDEPIAERLVGVLDAISQGDDGSYTIMEHKTSARTWSPDRLAYDLQLSAYSLAGHMIGLGHPQIQLQILLKTNAPRFVVCRPPRTERDHEELQRIVVGVVAAIRAGVAYPQRDWWCRSCGYQDRCVGT